MNVLVLYGFRDLALARSTSLNHLFCFQRYAPEHNYLYHCGHQSVTKAMREIEFSAVILDTSFFSQRTSRPREVFKEFRDRWAWLADIKAAKVGLPQDEYDHCGVLDDWIHDLKVDTVYSVVGHREVLYPRSLKTAQFVDALTGYIDDEEAHKFHAHSGPLGSRSIDLGYRARDLEFQYGRHGRLKAEVHHQFTNALMNSNLKIDSKIAPNQAILGDDWVRFLCQCRFTPAIPSGVSMWDPRGDIRDRTEEFLRERPHATFEEAEAACFHGLDGRYRFTAISPRLFEAAAAGACQILMEGTDYVGLRPNEHYIPLRSDFSDLAEVVGRLRDLKSAQAMVDSTYETLFSTEKFRYRRFARELLERAAKVARGRGAERCDSRIFPRQVAAHDEELRRLNALASEPRQIHLAHTPSAGQTVPSSMSQAGIEIYNLLRRLTPRPIRRTFKRALMNVERRLRL